MMLIAFIRRYPALTWPLLLASAALLIAGLLLLVQGA